MTKKTNRIKSAEIWWRHFSDIGTTRLKYAFYSPKNIVRMKNLGIFWKSFICIIKDVITVIRFVQIVKALLPFVNQILLIIWISMMGGQ